MGIAEIVRQSSGIRLDIGCGGNKQPGFVGMDRRPLPGVDIVHDLEVFPWPVPDGCCLLVMGSHIVEHIKPWLMIPWMDEIWRVMRDGGELLLSTPYAGSPGYWQDPTHCNGCNEATWQYFDPDYPLYQIYKPLPWQIRKGFPVWQNTGNMEVVMIKRWPHDGAAALGVNVMDGIGAKEHV